MIRDRGMNVLHVIPGVADRYGGPSRAVTEMCRALQNRGLRPTVVTTNADGEGTLPVTLGQPVDYRGVETVFFPRQFSEAFKYSRPLAVWLDGNVARFDLVHIHAVFSHSSVAAASVCRKRGVPYIVRPLGSLDPWSLKQKRFRKWVLWRMAGLRMLKLAASVHYTTKEERRLAESALELERGIVIPLGVDEELLRVSQDEAGETSEGPMPTPYMLVLSRIHPKKGLELLLDAFVDLVHKEPFEHWGLVVAGDGNADYVRSLRKKVSEGAASGKVVFTGWLEGPDKISTLRAAGLLAMPSYQENFALSVVESMALGVPVLVSEQVNLADEIESANAGWVVKLEKSALMQALADAIGSAAERARRGAAGRSLVLEHFRWPRIAEELENRYRHVVGDSAGNREGRA